MEELKSKLLDLSIFKDSLYDVRFGEDDFESYSFKDIIKTFSKQLVSILEDKFIKPPDPDEPDPDYDDKKGIKIDDKVTTIIRVLVNIMEQIFEQKDEPPESILNYIGYIKKLIVSKNYEKYFKGPYKFIGDEEYRPDDTGVSKFFRIRLMYKSLSNKQKKNKKEPPVKLLKNENDYIIPGYAPTSFMTVGSKKFYEPMSVRRQMKQRSMGSSDPYDQLLESMMRLTTV